MDGYGHLMEGVNTVSADKLSGFALGIKDENLKNGSKWEKQRKRKFKNSSKSSKNWCRETELNRRHKAFQASALPTELSRHLGGYDNKDVPFLSM